MNVQGLLVASFLAVLGLEGPALAPSRAETPATPSYNNFYVAPDGREDGTGAIDHPWNLVTALSHPKSVKPGDTIWLRDGTYKGAFRSKLTGTATAPIIVRQYPGERATIDRASLGESSTLTIRGAYAWYWGFEVTNSHPQRVTTTAGSHPKDLLRGDGVAVYGPYTKLINLIVHDNADGIGLWKPAVESEVYGTLTYNNGWSAPDRAHGHGLYIQNETGTKKIIDVISFNNFTTGMKGYAQGGQAVGMRFEGVVSFNNGSPLSSTGSDSYTNLFVGTTSQPADRITITDTYLYHHYTTVPDLGGNLVLGYTSRRNGEVSITNSYIAGGTKALRMSDWETATVSGNTFYAAAPDSLSHRLVDLRTPGASIPRSYQWRDNRYFYGGPSKPFKIGNSTLDIEGWRQALESDGSSQYTQGPPDETRVFVRENRFEPGRAHIVVYNWKADASTAVDVGAILSRGTEYEVRNVQDYFGPAVLSGVYDGSPLKLPLTGTTVAGPIGHDFIPASTAPVFNVFVLTSQVAKPAGLPVNHSDH